tara:strand:- start:1824 stop:1934 length:111 start_codon:yes stop_codon:yes gene_type:complete
MKRNKREIPKGVYEGVFFLSFFVAIIILIIIGKVTA